MTDFIEDRLLEEFWADKGISIEIVAKDIGRWKVTQAGDEAADEEADEDDSGGERIPMPDDIRADLLAMRHKMSANELFA